jgi:hypothetical protein
MSDPVEKPVVDRAPASAAVTSPPAAAEVTSHPKNGDSEKKGSVKINYLAKGIEAVTALLAAFGGFLLNLAPPDETGVKFAVGISSFLAFLAFLFISVFAQKNPVPKNRKYWIIAAALFAITFTISAFVYSNKFEKLTFIYPPDDTDQVRYVNGTQLTPDADKRMKASPNLSRAELLDKFGEDKRHEVWTQESIDNARQVLVVNYVLVVLSLALAVFCLTEGILLRTGDVPSTTTEQAR